MENVKFRVRDMWGEDTFLPRQHIVLTTDGKVLSTFGKNNGYVEVGNQERLKVEFSTGHEDDQEYPQEIYDGDYIEVYSRKFDRKHVFRVKYSESYYNGDGFILENVNDVRYILDFNYYDLTEELFGSKRADIKITKIGCTLSDLFKYREDNAW